MEDGGRQAASGSTGSSELERSAVRGYLWFRVISVAQAVEARELEAEIAALRAEVQRLRAVRGALVLPSGG